MANEDYRCPNCDTTIRATNIEYWYDTDGPGGDGKAILYPLEAFEGDVGDSRNGEQLWYCPAPPEECRIMRLFPGDSE